MRWRRTLNEIKIQISSEFEREKDLYEILLTFDCPSRSLQNLLLSDLIISILRIFNLKPLRTESELVCLSVPHFLIILFGWRNQLFTIL